MCAVVLSTQELEIISVERITEFSHLGTFLCHAEEKYWFHRAIRTI